MSFTPNTAGNKPTSECGTPHFIKLNCPFIVTQTENKSQANQFFRHRKKKQSPNPQVLINPQCEVRHQISVSPNIQSADSHFLCFFTQWKIMHAFKPGSIVYIAIVHITIYSCTQIHWKSDYKMCMIWRSKKFRGKIDSHTFFGLWKKLYFGKKRNKSFCDAYLQRYANRILMRASFCICGVGAWVMDGKKHFELMK